MEQAAIVLALVAACLFGLALALTPFGLRDLRPLSGAAIGIPSAMLLLWLTAPFLVDFTAADARAIGIFAGVGLMFPVSVTLLTFVANQRLGPGTAAALGNLAPLFAILFAILVLGETPRAIQVVGLVIVVAGVTLLALGQGQFGRAVGLALLLPVAAAAIRGLVQPLTKLGLGLWPAPLAAALIGYTVSTAVVLATAWQAGALPVRPFRPGAWWFVLVGFCNAGAVLALYGALARGPVGLVAPLVGTYPLVTLLLGFVLQRKALPSSIVVTGVIVTVIGIVVLVGG